MNDDGALDDLLCLSDSIDEIRTIGLYFLFYRERLVYIGQSHCCQVRINQHLWQGEMKFDRYTIARRKENRSQRMKLERYLIDMYDPIYNRKPEGQRHELIDALELY